MATVSAPAAPAANAPGSTISQAVPVMEDDELEWQQLHVFERVGVGAFAQSNQPLPLELCVPGFLPSHALSSVALVPVAGPWCHQCCLLEVKDPGLPSSCVCSLLYDDTIFDNAVK